MGRHSLPDPDDADESVGGDHPDQAAEVTGDLDAGYQGGEPKHGIHSDAGSDAQQVDHPGGDDAHDEYQADYQPDYQADFASGDDTGDAGFPDGVDPQDTDDYPDFPRTAQRLSGPEPPPGGGHRGGDEWRGGHRSEGGRRGVSIGVIAVLVTVVVVVAAVILYRFFGHELSNRSHSAAGRCVGGKDTVAVIADPSIADRVQEFADRYNGSAGPIGDRCVRVDVKPADSDAVIQGFIGNWPAELGQRPGLWIPGSSVSSARLAAAAGKQTISDSRSLVTSPVLLAVRPELLRALGNQTWATLPGLQTQPDAWAGLNLPSWGSLRLALPVSGNGDAVSLAGEAVAAAAAPSGAPATEGSGAVRTLLDGQPKLADNSLVEAMNSMLKAGDPASAPVHAVVTTEQQLFQRGKSLQNAASTLSSWLPPGPVAVADYPTVLLSGPWLSPEQTTAASAFAHFIRKPDQLAELAKAGFRVQGVKPPSSQVTKFSAVSSTLSVGDDSMRATLADAMATSTTGPVATIMLDQSMATDEGGKSRLANVVAALESRIKALPATSFMGLWTFDGKEGRAEVPNGPLADPVNGQPRSAALTAALDKQYSSSGGAVSFTTLRLVYGDALANFHAGQPNSVLVITAGPHTDQTLDGPGLQAYIRQSVDPAKPVPVNVIDFGADPDRATWEAVAGLSGGSYRNLATSASPDLATAMNTFLS